MPRSLSTFCLLMASRMFRYIPHIVQNPGQIWLTPFFLMHLYAHTYLKIYALFTLTNVSLLLSIPELVTLHTSYI